MRVGDSRVLLELVLRAFRAGNTPEAIIQSYDTLSLRDVYVIASYYLTNPAPFDEYLRVREQAARAVREKIEAEQPSRENLQALIMARAKAKGLMNDQTGE